MPPSLAAAAALLVLTMACAHAHASLRHRALAVCFVAYPFAALHVVAGVALLAAGACAALAFLGATALLVERGSSKRPKNKEKLGTRPPLRRFHRPCCQ